MGKRSWFENKSLVIHNSLLIDYIVYVTGIDSSNLIYALTFSS